MYVYIYIYIYMCVYIHIYTHTHTQTHIHSSNAGCEISCQVAKITSRAVQFLSALAPKTQRYSALATVAMN